MRPLHTKLKDQIQHYRKNISVRVFFIILLLGSALYFLWSFKLSKLIFYLSEHPNANNNHLLNETLNSNRYNVSALVFYGRRRYVEILNCYLEQNLVVNGGLLSEVIFVLKTQDKGDISYLNELVAQHPNIYSTKTDPSSKWTFHIHYHNLDPNRYYVKIDDDILYIHPDTIQSMLTAKLNNPSAMFISANVINHPNIGKLHLHLRALLNVNDSLPMNAKTGLPIYSWDTAEYANLHHRSFLRHHKNKTLNKYIFPIWNYNTVAYDRWSINFILFKGNDIQDVGPGDDEYQISVLIPKKYKRHSLVVGTALVVHFGYLPQRHKGLRDIDFISEYRDLALQICNSILPIKREKRTISSV